MIPVQAIAALAIAAVSFGAAWAYQGARYEREIADQRAEQLALLAEAQANARFETERMAKAKADAERSHQVRLANISRDAAAARDDLERVRNASTEALLLSGHSHATCIDRATALKDVFDQCSGAFTGMAAAADRLNSDRQTLSDSWPEAKHGNDQD